MSNELFRLHLHFIKERERLVEMAGELGLNHPRVLAQSRKVDALVVELQKRKVVG